MERRRWIMVSCCVINNKVQLSNAGAIKIAIPPWKLAPYSPMTKGNQATNSFSYARSCSMLLTYSHAAEPEGEQSIGGEV